MVLNKWWPWLPVNSKRYEASIRVRCLKGAGEIGGGACTRLTAELRWKGCKSNGFKPFKDLSLNVKRNCTREEAVGQNGVVWWDEEFRRVCSFSVWDHKDDCSTPWDVAFFVLNAADQGQKNKLVVAGPVDLDLAPFTSIDTEKELEIGVPSTSVGSSPTLCLTIRLTELKTIQEPPRATQRSLTMPSSASLPLCFGVPATLEDDESPSLKRSLRKGKSLKVSPDNEALLEEPPEKVDRNSCSYGTLKLSPKFQMLKRMLSFKSAKGCKKIEPLMISEFGDWEHIEVLSRDGLLELQTQVFFATIDQRSEEAAGESACTVLVALLAHWLHSNHGKMPIRSDFDRLIIDGSLQWRKLCENKSYIALFPNKHFDLETVLKAKICPISMSTTTGFFHPECMESDDISRHLKGSISFDRIWNEISTNADPLICIVSWNDHFFVLKVDSDAYYVIDTLGERLHEGCNRAYMLKFDKDTTIRRVTSKKDGKFISKGSLRKKSSSLGKLKSKMGNGEGAKGGPEGSGEGSEAREEEAVVCRGKEACKEYIKSFLAAIPIREWQFDRMEGRDRSYELLLIDVHYTQLSSTPTETSCTAPGEAATETASVAGEAATNSS